MEAVGIIIAISCAAWYLVTRPAAVVVIYYQGDGYGIKRKTVEFVGLEEGTVIVFSMLMPHVRPEEEIVGISVSYTRVPRWTEDKACESSGTGTSGK